MFSSGTDLECAAVRCQHQGFTLIELMIVVAIIAVLSAVALPAYNTYRASARERACMAEAKNYTNWALAALHNNANPGAPTASACQGITDASAFTDLSQTIVGTPRVPGRRSTQCNLANGGNCILQ